MTLRFPEVSTKLNRFPPPSFFVVGFSIMESNALSTTSRNPLKMNVKHCCHTYTSLRGYTHVVNAQRNSSSY